MKVYFDTGALVKLYIVESGSDSVEWQADSADVIPVNALQETELRNALCAAFGRKIIDETTLQRTLRNLDEDIRDGFLKWEPLDWAYLWRRASQIGRQHTPMLLCRTLDILHIAAAELLEVDRVVSGDRRQIHLCQALGISVVSIGAEVRKK